MAKPLVIVFTTAYYPFIGGAEIAVEEVVKRLSRRFDFYIVTARTRKNLPRREARPEGIVIRVGLGTSFDKWFLPLVVLWNREFGIWSFARGRRILWGMDISQGSCAAAIVKFFRPRIPFLLTIQYGDGEKRLAAGRLGMIGRAFRCMLGRADSVTAISQYLFAWAQEYGYDGPGSIVPNGVDVRKFQGERAHRHEGTGKIIITTSRLVPKNGVDVLIAAIAEVKKKIPDAACYIIGDGPERKNLELQVTNYKLQENVRFFGAVPHEEIPRYLHGADIFVRSSRSEGMGNSFVEALAAGVPVIGTPVGGIPDIIKDGSTGLFSAVGDAGDLAEKIILLLRDSARASQIAAEGGRMARERFSWDAIAASYDTIFSAISARKKIIIATPLYPPAIGGPALYAKHLGDEFRRRGYRVRIVSFGAFLRFPSGIRHLFYGVALFWRSVRGAAILSLDSFSVGAPAALVSWWYRIPLAVRLEGDFLWERFVERERSDCTLPEFISGEFIKSKSDKCIRSVMELVHRRAAHIVFSSGWRRKMAFAFGNISAKKAHIVANAWPDKFSCPASERKKIILWAGRMLYLKNLYRLIRAFRAANKGDYELHLVGEGPERFRVEEYVKNEGIKDVFFLRRFFMTR